MIQVENLSKNFADFAAVTDLSLRVNKGDVLGFLGPNGAGKSTTMKMLVGFLRPSAGQIHIDGIDMRTNPIEGQKRLGYLPEGAPAWGEMTPRGFLQFIANIRMADKDSKSPENYIAPEKYIERAVALTQLHHVLDQPIDTLSKGYRRRVGLAQAILHNPDILIMDEPTDGLDPNQKAHIREAIKEMAADTAIIVSTHILEEVDAICTQAMIIDKGRTIISGTPAELMARSRYCGAVEVIAEAAQADKIVSLLAPHFSQIEKQAQNNNDVRFCVFPDNKTSLPAPDFLTAVQNCLAPVQGAIHALSLQSGRLDDVFASLTTNKEQN